jgi:hypothetical protein
MKKKKNILLKFLLLITVSTLISLNSHGQSIPSYQNYSAGLNPSQLQNLVNLNYGEQTTAFNNASGLTVIGNGPAQVLDINASDFNGINFSNPLLSSVKLIRIRYSSVSDFQQPINLTGLSILSNLQHVHLLSSINANAAQLNSAFVSIPNSISTYYSISIPN